MTHPIPTAALDDRLGFVGTSGSGKTYGAGTAVERLLAHKSRVVIPDPLGVWWGLRLVFDGKHASPFEVVIFGGPHGDLPITEHAGALIGETVASMKESAIIDLSELGTKAAERRFMLAFLSALYKNAPKDQLHVVFDEADMWAPQVIRDRDQEPQKLLGMMETIVRRGRIRGFVPWLISQRPAVLNKDVLSQVDGLVAFKLTATQDRKALGDWIEGQADKEEGKRILAELPTKQVGEAVVWLPARGVLTNVMFPPKATFDSSRAPKKGEKRTTAELQPLDLGKLKDRLAKVEQEAKENDPKALKAEIARLKRELSGKGGQLDRAAIEEAEQRGIERGRRAAVAGIAKVAAEMESSVARAETACADVRRVLASFATFTDAMATAPPLARRPAQISAPRQAPSPKAPRGNGADTAGDTSGPQRTVLKALAWWKAMGHDQPTRAQVAGIAGWKITSGHLKNVLGSLRTSGLIDYPTPGSIALTSTGAAAAPEPDLSQTLIDGVRAALDGPQRQIFDTLLRTGPLPRGALAAELGWQETSGHLKNVLGSLRTLQIVDYPQPGQIALRNWVTS